MESPVAETAETDDEFLGGQIRLWQPQTGYRIGSDSILLAAAVRAGAGERVLDVGSGSGAISIALAHRLPGVLVDGLELQPELQNLASRNAERNGLADRVRFVPGDLAAPPRILARNTYDHVVTNPPYLPEEGVMAPPHAQKATAHMAQGMSLEKWITQALKFLKPYGWLHLIQRADRLDDIMAGLHGKGGDITIVPLWPGEGKAARRVIVRMRKGGRGPLTLHPGVVLHAPGGDWTPAVEAVLRRGAALEL